MVLFIPKYLLFGAFQSFLNKIIDLIKQQKAENRRTRGIKLKKRAWDSSFPFFSPHDFDTPTVFGNFSGIIG